MKSGSGPVSRWLRFWSSLNATIWIILSLGIIFLLGLWIPQKAIIAADDFVRWRERSPGLVRGLEFLRLTEIYTSPVTILLWILFFTNLALAMWNRVPLVLKRISREPARWDDPAKTLRFPHKATVALSGTVSPDEVAAFFRKRRYSVALRGTSLFAVKNRLSPVATLMFHLSFFLILVGGIATLYTRFTAELVLAAGEPFHGEREAYRSPRMPKLGSVPKADFLITEVTPTFEGNTATGLRVALTDGAGRPHVAGINSPYTTGATSFVVKDLGLSPLVVLYDRDGKEIDGAYVKLNVLKGRTDDFVMHGHRFRVRFFPDYRNEGGVESSASDEMKNPVFRISQVGDGTPAAEAAGRPGEPLDFGDYRLVVRELPYWVKFLVVSERGTGLLYAGFAVAAAAMVWRLLFYRREILGELVRVESGMSFHLAGRSEFYSSLAEEEFVALCRELAERSFDRICFPE